MSHETPESLTY